MKRFMKRVFAIAVCLSLGLSCLGLLSAAAETKTVNVKGDGATTIFVAECFAEQEGLVAGEQDNCGIYFDDVGVNEWFTVKLNIAKAGNYKVAFSTGWGKGHVAGNFKLELDGQEIGTLVNTVEGIDWRSWKNTSEITVTLPAGAATLRVTSLGSGPNIRALKFAPENMTIPGDYLADFFNDSDVGTDPLPVVNSDTMGVHFSATQAFHAVELHCPTWQKTGSGLTIQVFAWNSSYEESLTGAVLAEKTIENISDGAWIRFYFDELKAGEYLLHIKNSGKNPDSSVGIYAMKASVDYAETFRQGLKLDDRSARMRVVYAYPTDTPHGEINTKFSQSIPFHGEGRNPVEVKGNYAVQFATTAKFESLSMDCPSWSNNLGNLTFSLYRWNTNYETTLKGSAAASHEFVNYKDNATLTFKFDEMEAGEYLLLIENTSEDPKEQVGLYADNQAFAYAKNYQDGSEVQTAAWLKVQYTEEVENKYGKISNPSTGETGMLMGVCVFMLAAAAALPVIRRKYTHI